MAKFKRLEDVRVKGIPSGHPDAIARIQHIYEDGRIWISNLNMPYYGSISTIVTEESIEKIKRGG